MFFPFSTSLFIFPLLLLLITATPASLISLDVDATYPLFDDMLAVVLYAFWWEENVGGTDKLPACVRARFRQTLVSKSMDPRELCAKISWAG